MRSRLIRLAAIAAAAVLLVAAYNRANTSSVMTESANRLLASLTPEQRAKATFSFEDAERVNWFVNSRVGSSCPKSVMVS